VKGGPSVFFMGGGDFAERKTAPRTEVVRPEYLTPYHFG
jgi:hypothetical protein